MRHCLFLWYRAPIFEGSKRDGKATHKNVSWFAPCLFDGGNDESIDEKRWVLRCYWAFHNNIKINRVFIQSSHYVVDYDAIFAESGGQLKDYWELPLEIDRNLDEVPSKKRSMYRKRYAMLDDLAKVIEEKLEL